MKKNSTSTTTSNNTIDEDEDIEFLRIAALKSLKSKSKDVKVGEAIQVIDSVGKISKSSSSPPPINNHRRKPSSSDVIGVVGGDVGIVATSATLPIPLLAPSNVIHPLQKQFYPTPQTSQQTIIPVIPVMSHLVDSESFYVNNVETLPINENLNVIPDILNDPFIQQRCTADQWIDQPINEYLPYVPSKINGPSNGIDIRSNVQLSPRSAAFVRGNNDILMRRIEGKSPDISRSPSPPITYRNSPGRWSPSPPPITSSVSTHIFNRTSPISSNWRRSFSRSPASVNNNNNNNRLRSPAYGRRHSPLNRRGSSSRTPPSATLSRRSPSPKLFKRHNSRSPPSRNNTNRHQSPYKMYSQSSNQRVPSNNQRHHSPSSYNKYNRNTSPVSHHQSRYNNYNKNKNWENYSPPNYTNRNNSNNARRSPSPYNNGNNNSPRYRQVGKRRSRSPFTKNEVSQQYRRSISRSPPRKYSKQSRDYQSVGLNKRRSPNFVKKCNRNGNNNNVKYSRSGNGRYNSNYRRSPSSEKLRMKSITPSPPPSHHQDYRQSTPPLPYKSNNSPLSTSSQSSSTSSSSSSSSSVRSRRKDKKQQRQINDKQKSSNQQQYNEEFSSKQLETDINEIKLNDEPVIESNESIDDSILPSNTPPTSPLSKRNIITSTIPITTTTKTLTTTPPQPPPPQTSSLRPISAAAAVAAVTTVIREKTDEELEDELLASTDEEDNGIDLFASEESESENEGRFKSNSNKNERTTSVPTVSFSKLGSSLTTTVRDLNDFPSDDVGTSRNRTKDYNSNRYNKYGNGGYRKDDRFRKNDTDRNSNYNKSTSNSNSNNVSNSSNNDSNWKTKSLISSIITTKVIDERNGRDDRRTLLKSTCSTTQNEPKIRLSYSNTDNIKASSTFNAFDTSTASTKENQTEKKQGIVQLKRVINTIDESEMDVKIRSSSPVKLPSSVTMQQQLETVKKPIHLRLGAMTKTWKNKKSWKSEKV